MSLTIKIIQNNSQKKTQENSWVKLWSEFIRNFPNQVQCIDQIIFDQVEKIAFRKWITNNFSISQTNSNQYDRLQ